MKAGLLLGLAALILIANSCTPQKQSVRIYTDEDAQKDPNRYIFSDREVDGWRKAALEAVTNENTWVRLGVPKTIEGPQNLDLSTEEFNLHCANPNYVEVLFQRQYPHGLNPRPQHWQLVVVVSRMGWQVVDIKE